MTIFEKSSQPKTTYTVDVWYRLSPYEDVRTIMHVTKSYEDACAFLRERMAYAIANHEPFYEDGGSASLRMRHPMEWIEFKWESEDGTGASFFMDNEKWIIDWEHWEHFVYLIKRNTP